MIYDADWIHPARTVEQARCSAPNCSPEGLPGTLVMASTLNDRGWCAACARTADETDRLRLEI